MASGAANATHGVDVAHAMRDAVWQSGSNAIYRAALFDTLSNIQGKNKMIEGMGGGDINEAVAKYTDVTAGEITGKVNRYAKEANDRGVTTFDLAAQYKDFETHTGLKGMAARVGYADYMVRTGLAKDRGDAYLKMAQEGLIPTIAKIEQFGGDMQKMYSYQSTVEAARVGDIEALREVARAVMGRDDNEAVRATQRFLKSSEGMNEAAKFMEILDIARQAGIEDKWKAFMAHQRTGVEMTLTADQAKRLFGSGAPGGFYRISRGEDGSIIFAHRDSGFEGRTLNRDSFDGVVSLGAMDKFASDPNLPQALREIFRRAASFMRSKGLPYAHMNMVRDPNGGPNSVGFLSISAGGTALVSNYVLDKNGYRSMDEAVRSGEYGSYVIRHHGEEEDRYGRTTVVGNDVWNVLHGETGIIGSRYSSMFAARPNTQLAEVFLSGAAKDIQEYLKENYEHIKNKGARFEIDARLSKLLGIGAGGSLSLDDLKRYSSDVNLIRQRLWDQYQKIQNFSGLSQDQKAVTFEKFLSGVFNEGIKIYESERDKKVLPDGPPPQTPTLPDMY